jgi:hypothetical protein
MGRWEREGFEERGVCACDVGARLTSACVKGQSVHGTVGTQTRR